MAETTLTKLSEIKESYSFEIIEAVDSYTRAGCVIWTNDGCYLIDGSSHSIKNGIHYVKLNLKKFG